MKAHIITIIAILGAFLNPYGVQYSVNAAPPNGVPKDAQPFNGKWYLVYVEKATWKQAQERCRALGGQLACVPDAATQHFLANIPKGASGASMKYWLGATTEPNGDKWIWSDGSEMNYTNWIGTRDPRKLPTLRQEPYLALDPLTFWIDAPNDHPTTGFICEWPATKAPNAALVAKPKPENTQNSKPVPIVLQPAPDEKPEAIAKLLVETYFLKQNESLLTKSDETQFLYELRKPKLNNIKSWTLTETDDLNKVKSRVDFQIECSHWRIKLLHLKEGWQDWHSGAPGEDGVDGLPMYFRFQKRNGKWSVGRISQDANELEELEPIDLIKPTPEESTQP